VARFKILRLLHQNPELTQRELGERLDISLGAVNYSLRALIERGLVKVGNSKATVPIASRCCPRACPYRCCRELHQRHRRLCCCR
jgi:predicted transcriptional regulator